MSHHRQDAHNPEDLYARVGKIETDVASLGTEMRSFGGQLAHITKSIDDLSSRQHAQTQMNWPLLVSVLAMVCGMFYVAGHVVRMYVESEVRPLSRDIVNASQRIADHQSDGHPHTVIGQIKTLDARFSERAAETQSQLDGLREQLAVDREHTRELRRLRHGMESE